MTEMLFRYKNVIYPTYIRDGQALRFILPVATHFCRGSGLDIGSGRWPFPNAMHIELTEGRDAMDLPEGHWDYIFSSHCLEHLVDPIRALEHWKSRLKE